MAAHLYRAWNPDWSPFPHLAWMACGLIGACADGAGDGSTPKADAGADAHATVEAGAPSDARGLDGDTASGAPSDGATDGAARDRGAGDAAVGDAAARDATADGGILGGLSLRVVTFNTGTNNGQPHDADGDDYGSAQADISDQHYGDGLAWQAHVDATRAFFARIDPDIVAFQEIFHSAACADIPDEFRVGFVCESWQPGDPTVAQVVLGAGYQVGCNLGKPDKCIGVKRTVGTLRGCTGDLCLDGLDGMRVPNCGGGSRIGRGVIDLVSGESLTVVNVHGTSGISPADAECRVAQIEQVFVDLDGAPAANGAVNLILGDLNTDPYRGALFDASARRWLDFVGDGRPFHFVSEAGENATPTYHLFNIDHVISDAFSGSCFVPGVTPGEAPVVMAVYFDHKPLVCDVTLLSPVSL